MFLKPPRIPASERGRRHLWPLISPKPPPFNGPEPMKKKEKNAVSNGRRPLLPCLALRNSAIALEERPLKYLNLDGIPNTAFLCFLAEI
uniref:Uncharacterized protein n=1 Tax=Bursaphelenchus xylophilus TaxID=6326 RepID=A0A1I7RPV3_BURXY